MAKILPFVHPDAFTWEEAVESGLEIYGPGELPPGVELSDLDDYSPEPAKVLPFAAPVRRKI
jgi:hypothetical protein